MSKYITPIRIWIAVAIVVGVIAVALMGVVIHLKTTESSCNAETVIEKYRYFFRSDDEQAQIRKQTPAEIVINACCNSTTEYTRPTSALTLLDVNVTILQNLSYGHQWFMHETCRAAQLGKNIFSRTLKIVDEVGSVRHVEIATDASVTRVIKGDRETSTDCACPCKCSLRDVYFSAIVKYPPPENNLNLSLIRLPAICKCVNNLP